ncbi:MAG: Macrolide export protein MacA [Alphaproteobacteria bacterium MarineAlpha2_Bin1]|nr:MAG: Macrolide export protein MacA [Alphaproteobacteria bacterium MarineAlpha2_Bin1]
MLKKFLNKKNLFITSVVVILAILLIYFSTKNKKIDYETHTITKGNIKNIISTSGKLKAVVTVDVGSQITGQISELLVDFNSPVKKNQLLARIDPRTFESQVRQAEANLSVAKANLKMQIATKERAKSELASSLANFENKKTSANEAKRVYNQNEELKNKGVVSDTRVLKFKSEFESLEAQMRSAKANYEAALANQKFFSAQVLNARAQISQKEALLEQSIIKLQYTFIRAPVSGIVIDRKVNLGQTVAASLNTPVLFTIAQNTKKMQVETNVDEADIGQIKLGQYVEFSVDAFQEKIFKGKVIQIRQTPTVVQNVVTYGVIVSVNNNSQTLLPGMTATVNIIISEIKNVILIPTRALSYKHEKSKRAKIRKHKENIERIKKNLTSSLNLNTAQMEKLNLLLKDQTKAIREINKSFGNEINKKERIEIEKKSFENKFISILNPKQVIKYKNIIKLKKNVQNVSGRVSILENNKSIHEKNIKYTETVTNFIILKSNNINPGEKVILGIKSQ